MQRSITIGVFEKQECIDVVKLDLTETYWGNARELYMRKGFDPQATFDLYKLSEESFLFEGGLPRLEEILRRKADPAVVDQDTRTPLHNFCRRDRRGHCVDRLIQFPEINPNFPDKAGLTPVIEAILASGVDNTAALSAIFRHRPDEMDLRRHYTMPRARGFFMGISDSKETGTLRDIAWAHHKREAQNFLTNIHRTREGLTPRDIKNSVDLPEWELVSAEIFTRVTAALGQVPALDLQLGRETLREKLERNITIRLTTQLHLTPPKPKEEPVVAAPPPKPDILKQNAENEPRRRLEVLLQHKLKNSGTPQEIERLQRMLNPNYKSPSAVQEEMPPAKVEPTLESAIEKLGWKRAHALQVQVISQIGETLRGDRRDHDYTPAIIAACEAALYADPFPAKPEKQPRRAETSRARRNW